MNLLLENKKIFFIILFVLICGFIMHFSRSNLVLHSIKNNDIAIDDSLLQFTSYQQESITDAQYCLVFTQETSKLKDNIIKTLDYIQKSYKTYDANVSKVDYENCQNILLASNYFDHLGSIEEIEQFVQSGGHLFLMQTLEPDSHFQVLHRHLGIINSLGFDMTTGIKMQSNLLIGADGQSFLQDSLDDYSLMVKLDKKAEVYMHSSTNNPILWKTRYGNGQIMVFNAAFLWEKTARGVIVGMLSLMDEAFIYPIFNAKTFYIDDFPAPIAKGRNDIIYSEFKQNLPYFYRNIWWPHMLQVANKYNIIYTGVLIETYNDLVEPPFTNPGDDEFNSLLSYGRELIGNGGELGYHGYNHQSLTMDGAVSKSFGYKSWQSIDDMKAAIQELEKYTKKWFPSYDVTSYVPPSNVLSEEGRIALKETLPNLVTIASLYTEDGTNRAYIQEFDIGKDKIINMPRISSGYYRNNYNEWEIANAITSTGVFSHFLHPDDVISTDRSQGGWMEMYKEFDAFMHGIDTRYPWLRALPATQAAYAQAATLHSRVTIDQTANEIVGFIDNFTATQYFILRSQHAVKDSINCTVQKIDSHTYLVTAEQEEFKILLKRDAS